MRFSAIQEEGYSTLNKGETVEFDLVKGPKDFQAEKVVRASGRCTKQITDKPDTWRLPEGGTVSRTVRRLADELCLNAPAVDLFLRFFRTENSAGPLDNRIISAGAW